MRWVLLIVAGCGRIGFDPIDEPADLAAAADELALGYTHACIVTDLGELACWGSNEAGQLGQGRLSPDIKSPVGIAGTWTAVAPGKPLTSPGFALDGGEEPELAGIYLIAPDGTPARVGWALANEFSDHVTERINYLYLAHSKLREASFGPELLVGDLPLDVRGSSRIRRGDTVIFEKPFLSGEANMSHTLANLEHHHFKYALFRQAGDLHVHMFGTATLSFADGIAAQAGDVFEIEAALFGLPLKNPLAVAVAQKGAVTVRQL